MEKKSPHVTCPASPQTLYMGQICLFFFVGFLEVFATLAQERPKTHGKTKKITPCHLSSFPSDPLHGSIFFVFFCFLEAFATLAQKRVKTNGKNKKNQPVSPVQLLLRPSPWVETVFFVALVPRGFCHCVSPTISVAHFFCVFCFPAPWVPEKNFHPDIHSLAKFSPFDISY